MDDMFTRTRALLGDAALEKLRKSRVALFGVGGVGGHCAEALIRAGVGHLLLVDTHGVWDEPLDLAVDAIDTVAAKADIALQAQKRGVPAVSCMGAGNKVNPFLFEAADIYETSVCPLCRAMRKARKDRGIEKLRVIYSREPRASRGVEGDGRNGRPAPASMMPVTATAGLLLASEAIRLLTGD